MNALTAILQLGSFDHHACDTALAASHVTVWGYSARKGSGSIELGMAISCVSLASFLYACVRVWRAPLGTPFLRRPNSWSLRVQVLVCVLIGCGTLVSETGSLVQYVTVCRALLHVS